MQEEDPDKADVEAIIKALSLITAYIVDTQSIT